MRTAIMTIRTRVILGTVLILAFIVSGTDLCLDGANLEPPFTVRASKHDVLHLAFVLDAALAGRFGSFLDGLPTSGAA
jgi:hypothetical protein